MTEENKIDDGGDAFPTHYDSDGGVRYPGMTLRAYFAAVAMQGILACPEIGDASPANVSKHSLQYADALSKELGE